jgi:hypothetical protein
MLVSRISLTALLAHKGLIFGKVSILPFYVTLFFGEFESWKPNLSTHGINARSVKL